MIKLVSVALIAAAVVGCLPASPAEAADPIEVLVASVVISVCEVALQIMMPELTKKAEKNLELEEKTFLHEVMLTVEMFLRHTLEQKLYDLDHKPLANKVANGSLSYFLFTTHALTQRSDGNSFIFDWEDDSFNDKQPGYRNVSGDVVMFSKVYSSRVDRLLTESARALRGNQKMALSTLKDSNLSGVHIDVIESIHKTLMNAGEFVVSSADLKAGNQRGYLEVLQASNQLHTISNKQASLMRASENLRNDTIARYALNERQEKADWVAAFEQAVRKWNVSGTAFGY